MAPSTRTSVNQAALVHVLGQVLDFPDGQAAREAVVRAGWKSVVDMLSASHADVQQLQYRPSTPDDKDPHVVQPLLGLPRGNINKISLFRLWVGQV